jgi:putative endopeptidase
MVRRLFAVLLTSVLAAGITNPLQAQSSQPANGRWGVDLTGFDRSVRPGDDFFRYVNGAWLARTQIAPAIASSV